MPGIDRKWFVCVFAVLAVRSRAFARSLSFKNLQNSLKITNLTANQLLALSRVSEFSDFSFFWKFPDFSKFSDFSKKYNFNESNLSRTLGAEVQKYMLVYLTTTS